MKANSEIPAMEDLLCAAIAVYTCSLAVREEGREEHDIEVMLPVGFTKEEYDNFIKKLDVEYDDGYGGQELFGTIWLKDGTWMDRGEYDGSEWWNHQVCPEIPDELEQPLKKT
tara:strand:+ start:1082 stop:1420 length:339 start_codon:yes stop_codon:yes gene_type:complete